MKVKKAQRANTHLNGREDFVLCVVDTKKRRRRIGRKNLVLRVVDIRKKEE